MRARGLFGFSWDTVWTAVYSICIIVFFWMVLDEYANVPAGDVPFSVYFLLAMLLWQSGRMLK